MFYPFNGFLTGSECFTAMRCISHGNNRCVSYVQCPNTMYHTYIRHLIFGLNLLFNFADHLFSRRRISGIFQGTNRFALMVVTDCTDENTNATTLWKMRYAIKIL